MAITRDTQMRMVERTGIGLRLPHIAEVVATRPPVGWLEIHPENFLANPHGLELLTDLAHEYPISVHTVGVSIGSADGIDRAHLARLRTLVDLVDPVLVSGHLAWSSLHGAYLNDLLPLPFTEEALNVIVTHLDAVQQILGRSFVIENPSSYVAVTTSTMSEVEFLQALTDRTGCRLLCDVSNVYLSGHNMGYDPYRFIDAFPADAVAELHMGGFTPEDDEATPGATLLVDTHATAVAGPAWDLYAYAVGRFGPQPTIIEWDSDLPPLAILIGEAATADRIGDSARETRHAVAR